MAGLVSAVQEEVGKSVDSVEWALAMNRIYFISIIFILSTLLKGEKRGNPRNTITRYKTPKKRLIVWEMTDKK